MTMSSIEWSARIVASARSWIGTPYHHQASCKAVGADCLGLVRGIFRELYGFDVTYAANYSRDWAEASGQESMLQGAQRYLLRREGVGQAGDVVIFRLRPQTVAKHAAILSGVDTMIHAMEGGPVCEVTLSHWWRRRIAGIFLFPEV